MKQLSLQQELQLKELYFKTSLKDIATKMNKSKKAIAELARKRGYKKIPNWTNDELISLQVNGAKKTSEIYRRSYNSCLIKKSRLCKSLKN
ncbi:MAG: hypothetical protein WC389_19470 [Lutibacter sp.]|jgi:hypothetical protein